MRVIEAQCPWSWCLTITPHIKQMRTWGCIETPGLDVTRSAGGSVGSSGDVAYGAVRPRRAPMSGHGWAGDPGQEQWLPGLGVGDQHQVGPAECDGRAG